MPSVHRPQSESRMVRPINEIRQYATMVRVFHKDSWASAAVYRVDFMAATLVSLFWLASGVVGLSIFYRFTATIAGWTYQEALTVLGTYYVVNGYRMLSIKPNLTHLADQVRRGTFDYTLLRPVNSLFLATSRRFNPASWWDLLWGLVLTIGAALSSPAHVGPGSIGLFCVGLFCSLALVHSLGTSALSLTIRIVQASSVDDLLRGIIEISQYPTQFYGRTASQVLTAVPIVALSTLPAAALLGKADAAELLVAPGVAGAAMAISRRLWITAVKNYSGASS